VTLYMKDVKIFNKDSRELSNFIKKGTVDFIVFSPPYWKLRNYGYDNQIGFKHSYDEYLFEMTRVFKECFKVLKEGRFMAINIGTVVSNEGMKFITGDFINKCSKVGFTFRKDIIWHKPKGRTKWQRGATQFSQNPYPLRYNTNINHEFILIFQKGELTSLNLEKEPKFNKSFIRQMAYSVWDIAPVNSPKNDEKHVAPYPEELPKRLIQLFSFKGETILDPFAGCGTTNKVAKELGRNSIAVELSKEYCELIKNKLVSVTFDEKNELIYDHSVKNEIEFVKEKMDSAQKEYLKHKKKYDLLLETHGEVKGLNNFL
jgi:modification methylase